MTFEDILLLFVVLVVVDCVYVGKMVNKRVAERFPDSTDGGFKLGWYAASRTLQMRRVRVPKPQVERGESEQAGAGADVDDLAAGRFPLEEPLRER